MQQSGVQMGRAFRMNCATLLVVLSLAWAEYGPVVALKWKVLRDCIAIASVLYLVVSSSYQTKGLNMSSSLAENGDDNELSATDESTSPKNSDDPLRWSFLPPGGGVMRINGASPAATEN